MTLLLFNTALQGIVNADEVDQDETIFNEMTQILAKAVDVVIIGRSLLYFRQSFKN